MDIVKIAEQTIDAGEVIKNPLSRLQDYIKVESNMNFAVADIEHYIDVKFAELHNAPENKEVDTSYINRLLRVNCIEEHRLLKICKGYKKTLERLIYREVK